jgi:hypothetical protein
VQETRLYQAALWAPLLEKAFARFAEQHGKYGDAFQAPGAIASGYEHIVGGDRPRKLYDVFYGPDVVTTDQASTAYRPGGAGIDPRNLKVLQQLVAFQDAAGMLRDARQTMHMTASAFPRRPFQMMQEIIQHLLTAGPALSSDLRQKLTALQGEAKAERWSEVQRLAQELVETQQWRHRLDSAPQAVTDREAAAQHRARLDRIRAIVVEVRQMDKLAPNVARLVELATAVQSVMPHLDPAMSPVLRGRLDGLATSMADFLDHPDDQEILAPEVIRVAQARFGGGLALAPEVISTRGSDAAFNDLVEVLADVINVGADTGGEQRFIYTGHEYSVHQAHIVDQGGARLTGVDEATLAAVDPRASTVTLFNPHHRNSPDELGTDRTDAGLFDLSLHQFLLHYSLTQTGVVQQA